MKQLLNSPIKRMPITVYFPIEEAMAVEEFRITVHAPSLSKAIRYLVRAGLNASKSDNVIALSYFAQKLKEDCNDH